MFTTYFKMINQPFTERVALPQILRDDRITQGLARLQHMVMQGNIALITGQTGVGKSTLIKLFLSSLGRNQYLPVYIHFTPVKAAGLLHLIVTELGEVSKRGKERLFMQIIAKVRTSNLQVFLIIDEAHLLNSEAITDIRLLASSPLDDAPSLKIILAGQEGLKNQLRKASLADFVHRISVHCHLPSLTKTQTSAYIDYQMKYAGASEKIFEQEVKHLIHEYANGIPRQVNNITTACLINASIKKIKKINAAHLDQTMAEFDYCTEN